MADGFEMYGYIVADLYDFGGGFDPHKQVEITMSDGTILIRDTSEPHARLMSDCVDGVIRACIYQDNDTDTEPEIHPVPPLTD